MAVGRWTSVGFSEHAILLGEAKLCDREENTQQNMGQTSSRLYYLYIYIYLY